MAEGKWITGLTPEMPADEAARVVLAVRLSAVRHHLPLAAEHAAEDVENVHQLRVATRRAGAAVWIFRDLMVRKVLRDYKRTLRAVRRAAGAARDWDVFLARLDPSGGAAAEFMAGYALRERVFAQETLAEVATEQSAAIHEGCAAVPAAISSPAGRTLGECAAGTLGELYTRLTAEVEAGPKAAAELHQLRITAKRFRYAIEVFAGCCAAQLREVIYPAVEEAQEILGSVQDAAVASSRLEQIHSELNFLPDAATARLQPGVAALIDDLKARVVMGEQDFRSWADRWRRLTIEHPLTGEMTIR